jgi:pimeloyl-ACP methyl ester carboxylesterase
VVLLPPQEWGHRLGYFFSDVTLKTLPGVGHFTPLEAPPAFAAAVRDALVTRDATN